MRPRHVAAPTATALLLLLLLWAQPAAGCNKALCASDVSKCLIQVGSLRFQSLASSLAMLG